MRSIRLRHLAEVNPATPEFDRLPQHAELTFMPLETVWADGRHDASRVKLKSDVVTGYTRFRDGDILLPKVTPTFQAGRVARVQDLVGGVGAGTTELHVLRARPGVDPRYVAYALRSKHFIEEGVTAFQGVAGLQRVPDRFVRDFEVADLQLEEQRRIADFLDTEMVRIDRLCELRLATAGLVKARVQSALANLFSSDRWQECKLKHLLDRGICYGVLVPIFVPSGGVPLIRVSDLNDLQNRAADLVQIDSRQSQEYRRTLVDVGDLLITVVGATAGKAALVPEVAAGFNVSRAVAKVRLGAGVDPYLVWAWTLSPRFGEQVSLATSNATAQPLLNVGDLANFRLQLPPNDSAQGDAAAQAREIIQWQQSVTRKNGDHLLVLAERRRALITAAVTGQLDVTTARGAA